MRPRVDSRAAGMLRAALDASQGSSDEPRPAAPRPAEAVVDEAAGFLGDIQSEEGGIAPDKVTKALGNQVLRGPDYSKGPVPRKTDGELTLREGDLPELHVTCCFAKLNVTLALGKGLKLWLYLNDGVTEAKDLGPCELFGFGVGGFVECTGVPPKDTIGERLIFSLQSDVDYIVEVQTVEGNNFDKRLDTGPLQDWRGGRCARCHYPGARAAAHDERGRGDGGLPAQPQAITNDLGVQAGCGEAIRCGHRRGHRCQEQHLWAALAPTTPPPCSTVKKPMAWLLGKTNLQPGSFYYLV